MTGSRKIAVRRIEIADEPWLTRLLDERWGGQFQVMNGRAYRPADLPGFVATRVGERVGYAALEIDGNLAWIGLIDALRPREGIGTALVATIRSQAEAARCRELRAVTTNDNRTAQRFYEALGFQLREVRKGAVKLSRRLKPSIALRGEDGVPIVDEHEYVLALGSTCVAEDVPT